MLPGFMGNIMMAGEGAAAAFDASFLQGATSGATTTTVNFAGISFGAAPAGGETRHIVVVAGGVLGVNSTLASCTIGGVAATIPITIGTGGSGRSTVGIAIAAVPTGASGTVAITWSTAPVNGSGIGVYRLMNLTSATPTDTASGITNGADLSLDVLAGGCILGCAVGHNVIPSLTGLTSDYAVDMDATDGFAAHSGLNLAATTGYAVTLSGGGPNTRAGVVASFR